MAGNISNEQEHEQSLLFCEFTSRPSMRRWSYVRATFMTGRGRISLPMTIARCVMACIPRMADCGGLMMGVDSMLPYTPPLEMVKVPPAMSSMEIVPSRAFFPSAAMACGQMLLRVRVAWLPAITADGANSAAAHRMQRATRV